MTISLLITEGWIYNKAIIKNKKYYGAQGP